MTFKYGITLLEIVSIVFKVSKSEAKRLIRQGAIKISFLKEEPKRK